VISRWIKL